MPQETCVCVNIVSGQELVPPTQAQRRPKLRFFYSAFWRVFLTKCQYEYTVSIWLPRHRVADSMRSRHILTASAPGPIKTGGSGSYGSGLKKVHIDNTGGTSIPYVVSGARSLTLLACDQPSPQHKTPATLIKNQFSIFDK